MCENSVYAENRVATERERLTLKHIPHSGHVGLYPTYSRTKKPKLVCIRKPTEVTLSHIDLRVEFHNGGDPIAMKLATLKGQTLSAWFMPGNYTGKLPGVRTSNIENWDVFKYLDSFVVNNARYPLYWFALGLRAEIGQPAKLTGKKGMTAIKRTLREIDALPPDPKPEDAEQQPQQPAPEQPVPAEAPAGDAPAQQEPTVTVRTHQRRRTRR
jgi:hypothetical protein